MRRATTDEDNDDDHDHDDHDHNDHDDHDDYDDDATTKMQSNDEDDG